MIDGDGGVEKEWMVNTEKRNINIKVRLNLLAVVTFFIIFAFIQWLN